MRGERLAQPATIDVLPAYHALGAPAVLQIQLAAGGRDAAGINHAGIAGIGLGVAATCDVVGKTARELDESLSAGVDDVCLAERLELLRGTRERDACFGNCTFEHRAERRRALCGGMRRTGEIGHYREDRAVTRLGQAFTRVS